MGINLRSLIQGQFFQLVVKSIIFFLSIFLLHLSGGSFLLQLLIVLMSFSLYGFESRGFFQFFFPFLYALILNFFSAFNFQGINFLVSSFSASVVFFISLGLRNDFFKKKREWNYALANYIFFYALFEFNGFLNINLLILLPVLFLSTVFLFFGVMSSRDDERYYFGGLKSGFLRSSVLGLLISEYFFVSRLLFQNGEFITYFLSLITIFTSFFLVFRNRATYKNIILSFAIAVFGVLLMLLL